MTRSHIRFASETGFYVSLFGLYFAPFFPVGECHFLMPIALLFLFPYCALLDSMRRFLNGAFCISILTLNWWMTYDLEPNIHIALLVVAPALYAVFVARSANLYWLYSKTERKAAH